MIYNNYNSVIKLTDRKILAWHIHDGYLEFNDDRTVYSGQVYKVAHDPKVAYYNGRSIVSHKVPARICLCQRGLHASRKIKDALLYRASGKYISRVEMRGWIGYDTKKLVATERKVFWTIKTLDLDKINWRWRRLSEKTIRKYIFQIAKKNRVKNPK